MNKKKIKNIGLKILENYFTFSVFIGNAVIFQQLLKWLLKFNEQTSAIFGFLMSIIILVVFYEVYDIKLKEKYK